MQLPAFIVAALWAGLITAAAASAPRPNILGLIGENLDWFGTPAWARP